MSRSKIIIPREVLLVEIERVCALPDCNGKTRIGLTKDEARAYCGFECERCGEWNADQLCERDVPEWWEELMVWGLHAVRRTGPPAPFEPGEIISRMSEDYRRVREEEVDQEDSAMEG